MNTIPTPDECLTLLADAGCEQQVIDHCKAVHDVAMKIFQYIPDADKALIEAGSLLHDIGRSRVHDITHAIEGATIARDLGLPERIVHIIENHLGAGVTPSEAKKLGLPIKDYTPKTIEEKIVTHADNLVDKDKQQPIAKDVQRALDRNQKYLALKLLQLHLELSELAGIDLDDILEAKTEQTHK